MNERRLRWSSVLKSSLELDWNLIPFLDERTNLHLSLACQRYEHKWTAVCFHCVVARAADAEMYEEERLYQVPTSSR